MTYEETVAYILEIPKFTKKNEPSHTREFMRRLGNPQDSFAVIHVAGSNGKGSVCAFLNSILLESGVHVGMFTSPHLVDIRERFMIDKKPCSRQQFLAAERSVRSVVETMQAEGMPHPTFFEYIFAVGMVLFRQAKVSCVVLETGLGGRLDATNVVEHPILTIITSISLEHTEILGDTIEAIAGEKAGIIKPGVPVVFDGSEPKAEKVILKIAEEQHAPVEKISMDSIKFLLNDGKSIDFSMDSRYDVTRVTIPFPAEYQVMNGALALAASDRLKQELPITEDAIIRGFANVTWPGRMEELEPDIYLDGAHNVSGIEAFLKAANGMAKEPSILLFSMVKEKNYREVVRLICSQGSFCEIILTQISDNSRALTTEELQQCFLAELEQIDMEEQRKNITIISITEPKQAYWRAREDKQPGQKLFCAGSLYLVGELKKITGGQMDD